MFSDLTWRAVFRNISVLPQVLSRHICLKALVSYFNAWVDLTFIPVDALNLCTEFSEPAKEKSFCPKRCPLFLATQANVICGRTPREEISVSPVLEEMLVSC
jgi:hypothetical protein